MRLHLVKLLSAFTIAATLILIAHTPTAAADQVFDKPLFLMVFDKTCHAWCAKVRPMVKELQEQYGTEVDFAEIDITQEVLSESKKRAKDLGVLDMLADFGDQVPCCAVFKKKRSSLIKELAGPKTKEQYESLVKLCLSKQ